MDKKKTDKKSNIKYIIIAIVFGVLAIGSWIGYNTYTNSEKFEIAYNDFLVAVQQDEINEITINKEKNLIYFKQDGVKYHTTYPGTENFVERMLLQGVTVKSAFSLSSTMLISSVEIIFFVLMISFFRKMLTDEADIDFCNAQDNKTTFEDVAGMQEIKRDLKTYLDMFSNEKYREAGARIPKVILFEGPPGNGKTLISKAFAGESGTNFIAVNACDFSSKFVSVGSAKIKRLFEMAKKQSPCVIFIDELDAIGSKRTDGDGAASKEFNSVLTALLNQMDGFETNQEILVLAATNRAEALDPALLRPGRFDKKLVVSEPDRVTRKELFSLLLKDKEVSDLVTVEQLSAKTNGCSCAEISTIVNEAIINATRENRNVLEMTDFENAILESSIKGHICEEYEQTQREKEIVAYHEAGHAIVAHYYGNNRVSFITTQPTTSGAGGFTLTDSPYENLIPMSDIVKRITMFYGGRAAEVFLTGNETEATVGASQDITQATELALKLIPIRDGIDYTLLGEKGNKKLTEAVEGTLRVAYQQARETIKQNRTALVEVAQALIEKDYLDEKEFLEILTKVETNAAKEKELLAEVAKGE